MSGLPESKKTPTEVSQRSQRPSSSGRKSTLTEAKGVGETVASGSPPFPRSQRPSSSGRKKTLTAVTGAGDTLVSQNQASHRSQRPSSSGRKKTLTRTAGTPDTVALGNLLSPNLDGSLNAHMLLLRRQSSGRKKTLTQAKGADDTKSPPVPPTSPGRKQTLTQAGRKQTLTQAADGPSGHSLERPQSAPARKKTLTRVTIKGVDDVLGSPGRKKGVDDILGSPGRKRPLTRATLASESMLSQRLDSPGSSGRKKPLTRATLVSDGLLSQRAEKTIGRDALPKSWVDEVLRAHNKRRSMHWTPPLVWSEDCFDHAKMQAEACAKKAEAFNGHVECMSGRMGQCVLGPPHGPWRMNHAGSVDSIVSQWYSESEVYDYDQPGFMEDAMNFMQIMWFNSTSVGMAVSRDGRFAVANYYPAAHDVLLEPPEEKAWRNYFPAATCTDPGGPLDDFTEKERRYFRANVRPLQQAPAAWIGSFEEEREGPEEISQSSKRKSRKSVKLRDL